MTDAIEGLVAHWPLDEGTGTEITDTGPRGAKGTLHGTAQWVDGRLVFDGASYILFGTAPSLEGKVPVTVCAWIKTTCLDQIRILQQRNGDYNGEYILSVFPGGLPAFFVFGDGGTQAMVQSPTSIADGHWHHVVGVRDEQYVRLYLDGVEVAAATGPIRNLKSHIDVGIGADIRDWAAYFQGSICEVSIYELALTPAHVGVLATQRPR